MGNNGQVLLLSAFSSWVTIPNNELDFNASFDCSDYDYELYYTCTYLFANKNYTVKIFLISIESEFRDILSFCLLNSLKFSKLAVHLIIFMLLLIFLPFAIDQLVS